MKNKLTNTRVINSIGIGILAAITAGTPVLASLNDSLNDDNTAEPVTSSEVPVESADVVTETQNAEIINSLTEAQEVIQAARDELNTLQQGESGENLDDTGEGNVPPAEEITSPAGGEVEGGGTVDPSDPAESEGNNEEAGAEGETQPEPDEVQPAPDEAQPAPDEVQPGEEGQEPSTGEEPENPSVTPDEGNEGTEPGNTETEEGVQTPSEPETKPEETPAQTIDECLENSENAVGNIISDINKLDRENEKIKDAIADYNAVVENPNNFIGSIVDIVSNASSAVVDAVDSVAADEKIAQEQAQVAINAQVKGYASREEAEAARQQAQAAAIAAEEAYKSAQITVEEAAKNKTIADNNLAELERQRDQAAAALQEIDARIKDAQDMLRIILESNGFDAENINPGAFDPGQLAGDAKEAYINVMNALNQAQDEFNKAQDSYNTAVQNVTDAEINYSEAVGTLDNLNAELKKANEEAAKAADALDQEKYKEIITAYEEQSAEVGELQFDVEEAKKVLEKAENAVKQAQDIKNQADAVVEKAEEAVKAANGEDAKKIVESAEDAVKQNTKNIEEYLSLIKEAEAELEKTAGEAQIAVEKLQGLKEAATAAEENLKDRKADLEAAEKKHTDAKDELKAAEDELQAVLEERLSTEQMRVKKAQEAAKSGHTTEEHTLAIELIRYNLSMYDKGIDTVEIKKDDERGWEITVSDSSGDKKTYLYSIDEDGMKVYQGTDLFYTESEFNKKVDADTEISQAKNNLNIKQNALIDAKKVFDDADVAFASATKEKEEADDKVQVLETLEAMAAALEKVHTQAEELVDAETSYREDCAQSADNLIEKLESLVSNKINYANASAKLSTVNNAKEAVENQIEKLTSLSVQQNVDKSAYNNLVAAYNEAKEDYDEAVEALEKCMAGRDHAETERNRARAAANAVFSYISGGTVTPTPPTQPDTNGSTTTPQPVDPMQPVYGTIIDTITSPVIGDTGASTGTNYTGYPGYTYTTWGGQTAYTADAPVASEEEPGEEDLVSVEDEAVPLAEVGEDSKNKSNNTTTTKTTRKVSDEKVPLADMETKDSKMSWWWILVIALLGATGTELYIRHKKKEEEEQKARRAKQNLVKI